MNTAQIISIVILGIIYFVLIRGLYKRKNGVSQDIVKNEEIYPGGGYYIETTARLRGNLIFKRNLLPLPNMPPLTPEDIQKVRLEAEESVKNARRDRKQEIRNKK